MARNDTRPICTCGAYKHPHRVGGRCKGVAFADNYFHYNGSACKFCNSNCGSCEVADGKESIKEAECYQEAVNNGDRYLEFVEVW